MQSVPPESSNKNMPYIGKWILLGSVLMNCFLLGLFVAPLLTRHPHFPPTEPGQFMSHMAESLPPEDAPVFRAAYDKAQPELSAGREAMDVAMHKVAIALEEPTVNNGDLQKALADINAAHAKIEQAMAGLIKQAAGLSAEGRRIFAENGLHPPGMHMHPPGPLRGDDAPPDHPPTP